MYKVFRGQHKDEKVLFQTRQNMWSLCISLLPICTFVIVCIIVIGVLAHIFEIMWLYGIAGIMLLLSLAWLVTHYRHNMLYITSRRIVRQERYFIFQEHFKELHIPDIKQTVASRQGFIETLFGYGTLTIHGYDDISHILYRGLSHHDEVALYVSRIVEYIRTNGPTDNLSSFKTRKERDKTGTS